MRGLYAAKENIVMSSGLQQFNENSKMAEWAARITDCRNSGQGVVAWCKENGVCTQTYYKWQKRLFETAQAQQEKHFVEVTPAQPMSSGGIAVTIRIGSAEAAIHNGADGATVEMVLRALRSC